MVAYVIMVSHQSQLGLDLDLGLLCFGFRFRGPELGLGLDNFLLMDLDSIAHT